MSKYKYQRIESRFHMLNPLTAVDAYIRIFMFLLAHYVPPFEHVKDKM